MSVNSWQNDTTFDDDAGLHVDHYAIWTLYCICSYVAHLAFASVIADPERGVAIFARIHRAHELSHLLRCIDHKTCRFNGVSLIHGS